MSEPYKNREIDERHNQIISRLDNIKDQVEETNGRVTNLEMWRNRIIGAIAIVTTLMVPVFLEVLMKNIF